jgi:hypothetical protein
LKQPPIAANVVPAGAQMIPVFIDHPVYPLSAVANSFSFPDCHPAAKNRRGRRRLFARRRISLGRVCLNPSNFQVCPTQMTERQNAPARSRRCFFASSPRRPSTGRLDRLCFRAASSTAENGFVAAWGHPGTKRGEGLFRPVLASEQKDNYFRYLMHVLAEGVGFEPTVPLQARRFSRPVP